MGEYTVQTIDKDGLNPTYAAVSSSDTFNNPTDQRRLLHVKNGGGGSINVTIVAQDTSINVPGAGVQTISNIVTAVPAGEDRMFGPFPEAYVDSAGDVTVQYSGTTSVTAGVFDLDKE